MLSDIYKWEIICLSCNSSEKAITPTGKCTSCSLLIPNCKTCSYGNDTIRNFSDFLIFQERLSPYLFSSLKIECFSCNEGQIPALPFNDFCRDCNSICSNCLYYGSFGFIFGVNVGINQLNEIQEVCENETKCDDRKTFDFHSGKCQDCSFGCASCYYDLMKEVITCGYCMRNFYLFLNKTNEKCIDLNDEVAPYNEQFEIRFLYIKTKYESMNCSTFFLYYDPDSETFTHRCQIYNNYESLKYRMVSEKNNNELNCFACSFSNCYEIYKGINLTNLLIYSPRKLIDLNLNFKNDEIVERCSSCENSINSNICVAYDYDSSSFQNETLVMTSDYDSIYFAKKLYSFFKNITLFNRLFPTWEYNLNYAHLYESLRNPKLAFTASNNIFCPLSSYSCYQFFYSNKNLNGTLYSFNTFLNYVNSSLDCKKGFTFSQVQLNKKNYSICRLCPNEWKNCLAKKNIIIIFNKTIIDEKEADYMIVKNLKELEEVLTFFQQNFQFFYMMNTFYVEEISFTVIFENDFNYFSLPAMENIVFQFAKDLCFFCKEVKMIFLGNMSNSKLSYPTIFMKNFIEFYGFSFISFRNLTLVIDDTDVKNSDNFGIQFSSICYIELINCKISYVFSRLAGKINFPYFSFGEFQNSINKLKFDYVDIEINALFEKEKYSAKEKPFIYINAIILDIHELCIFDSFLSNFPSVIQFNFDFQETQNIVLQSLSIYNSKFLNSTFITILNKNINYFPKIIFYFFTFANFSMTSSILLDIYDAMEFHISELSFLNFKYIHSSIFKIFNGNFEQYKLNVYITQFIASFNYFDTYLIFPKTYLIEISNLFLNSNTFMCSFEEIATDLGYGSFLRIPSLFENTMVLLLKNTFNCPKGFFVYLFEKIAEPIIRNSTFIFENQRNISFLYVNSLDSSITECKFFDLDGNSDRYIVNYNSFEQPLEISYCYFIGFPINSYKIFIPLGNGRNVSLVCLQFIHIIDEIILNKEFPNLHFIQVITLDDSKSYPFTVAISNSTFLNFKLFSTENLYLIIDIECKNANLFLKNLLFKNISFELRGNILSALCKSLSIESLDIYYLNQTNEIRLYETQSFIFFFQLLKFDMTISHFTDLFFTGNIIKIIGLPGNSEIRIENCTFLNIINDLSYSTSSSPTELNLFSIDCSSSFTSIKFGICIFENSKYFFGAGGRISIIDSKNIDFSLCLFRNYLVENNFLLYFLNSMVYIFNCLFLFDSILIKSSIINYSSLINVLSSELSLFNIYFCGISLISTSSFLIKAAGSKILFSVIWIDYLQFFQTAFTIKYSEFRCLGLVLMDIRTISFLSSNILTPTSYLFNFGSESLINFSESIFLNVILRHSSVVYMINAERCIWIFRNIIIWKFEGSSAIFLSFSLAPQEGELNEYNIIENNKFYDINGKENGGCLNLYQVSCFVSHNLFFSCNSLGNGGGIFYIGNIDNIISITNNTFVNNFAVLGGAINYFFLFKNYFKKQNNFTNCSSFYSFGKAIYSFPRKLILYNNSEKLDLTQQNFYSIQNFRSGDSFENLFLATYSEEDEIIIPTPLNIFFIKLTFPDNSYKMISQNEKGFFNISGFPFYHQPNSSIFLNISADFLYRENELQFLNDVKITFFIGFRFCLIGEIFNFKTNLACDPCENGKYSYDPYENDCRKCPNGADCSIKLNGIFSINPGYFRFRIYDHIVFSCYKLPNNCVGGTGKGDELCYEGHIGARCEACDSYAEIWKESFAKDENLSCIRCKEVGYNIFYFILNFIIFFFLLGGSIYGIKQTIEGKRTKEKEIGFGFVLKIFINYFQIISCIFAFKLPDAINFSSVFGKIESPIVVVLFSLDCWFGSNIPSKKFPITYLKLAMGITMAFLYLIISICLLHLYQLKYRFFVKKPLETMISLFVFIYFQKSLTYQIMKSLSCTQIGEEYFLKSDVNYFCYSPTYWYFTLFFSLPLFLIIVFMIPGFIFYKIYKNVKNMKTIDSIVKYGYIYNEYNVPYWEISKMTEKVLIVCILDYYEDKMILKGCLLLAIIFIYFILLIYKKPYQHSLINNLEIFMTIVCFKSILICILVVDDSFQYINYIGIIILALINIIFVIKIFLILFKIFISSFSNLFSNALKSKTYNPTPSKEVSSSRDNLEKSDDLRKDDSEKREIEKNVSDEKKGKFIKEMLSEIESEGEKGNINE